MQLRSALLVPIFLLACDPAEHELDVLRTSFDAQDVEAELAADPDAIFLVDLSQGDTIEFIQHDAVFDYGHFVVRLPWQTSMIPLEQLFEELPMLDPEAPEWAIRAEVEISDEVFRCCAVCAPWEPNRCILILEPWD